MASAYKPDVTIVFEVAKTRKENSSWVADGKLLRYFKRLGFRIVDFDYRYPVLQTYDGSMSYPADLMVKLPAERRVIAAAELRTILRCVYFKHYLRWDRPFLSRERFSEREKLINELYTSQVSRIDPSSTFQTSGFNKSSALIHFHASSPSVQVVAERMFGPKFFRVAVAMILVTVLERLQTNELLMIPDIILGLMVFSAAEDTSDTRRMLVALAGKLMLFRQRK